MIYIADIAHYGWLLRKEFADVDYAESPNVERWFNTVSRRPAVIRGIERTHALRPQALNKSRETRTSVQYALQELPRPSMFRR